ncbi:MAG: glycosyltransferase family 39 protein [Pseudomonadota bacterium]
MARHSNLLLCVLLCGLVAVLFITGAPQGNSFSWPDSPRHALNGAFIFDLLKDLPFNDPKGWAYDYYGQYPAVTILFYPPLYPATLAPFYAIFGVSQETALLVNFLFYCAFVSGVYALARRYFSAGVSFGVALIMASAPEVTYWGRQIMTEIPAFAPLVWSAWALLRHLDNGRKWSLFLSAFLLVAAMYIKISICFVAPVYALVLLRRHGVALVRMHEYWITAIGALMLLGPLIFLTLNFGQANAQSVTGVADSVASRGTFEGWIWYARQFPDQLGWPALALALLAVIAWFRRGRRDAALSDGGSAFWLFGLWLVIGYLFFSAIDLKEARHSIFLLLPLALAAGYAATTLVRDTRVQAALMIITGLATLGITLTQRPVHYVAGYDEAVAWIADNAPQDSNILFSGYRDGAFIYGMRALADRPDLNTIRADKLLLTIAVRRELGVKQTSYSNAEIADLISDNSVSYVVAQPDFWTDLDQMARLQTVLRSPGFEEVHRVAMQANYNAQESELVIYRNLAPLPAKRKPMTIELPIIDRQIETAG